MKLKNFLYSRPKTKVNLKPELKMRVVRNASETVFGGMKKAMKAVTRR